jgi:glyoxylase-like metal-dependent hydrolase (beta-lactamase superfamily II)
VTTWRVGDVRITKVPQMTWTIPFVGFVPEATAAACAERAPGLLADDGMADISLHGLVVESAGHTILVDTCVGHDEYTDGVLAAIPQFGSIRNQHATVRDAVVAAGWMAQDIDTVVCTHLHFDHVGGNLIDGEPAFPAARYVTVGDEWTYWSTTPSDDSYALVDAGLRPLVERGLVDLVDPAHVLTGEVRLVPTPGHTPGHVSVQITSGGEQAVITGDVAHHPLEFLAPEWKMIADVDPRQAVDTRRAFIDRYGDGETLVLGTHFGGSSAGRLDASARTWSPAANRSGA